MEAWWARNSQVPVSKPGSNIKRMWVCLERLFPEVGLMFPMCHGGTWSNPQYFSLVDVNEIGNTSICLDFKTLMQRIRVAQWKRGGPITHRSQDQNLALI